MLRKHLIERIHLHSHGSADLRKFQALDRHTHRRRHMPFRAHISENRPEILIHRLYRPGQCLRFLLRIFDNVLVCNGISGENESHGAQRVHGRCICLENLLVYGIVPEFEVFDHIRNEALLLQHLRIELFIHAVLPLQPPLLVSIDHQRKNQIVKRCKRGCRNDPFGTAPQNFPYGMSHFAETEILVYYVLALH